MNAVKEQLGQCFDSGRATVIGTSAVVSRKAHFEPAGRPGLIHILLEKDAGEAYLSQAEKDKCVHIHILHSPVEIDVFHLANRMKNAIYRFIELTNPDARVLPEEYEQAALSLSRRIYLWTGAGAGTVFDPGKERLQTAGHTSHVHILANLPPKYYAFINWIIAETEKAVTFYGAKLRPVRQIIHIHAKKNPYKNQKTVF